MAGETDTVLETLARHGIRASFFVVGTRLVRPGARALIAEAHRQGHWIGNHTLNHATALGERPDPAYARDEIEGCQRLIGDLASPQKLFRPVGNDGLIGPHLLSAAALAHLLEQSYTTVIWNSVPGDWRDPKGWVERAIAEVKARDWTCMALHDMEWSSARRLPELLVRLADLGVEFVQDFPEEVVLTRAGRRVSVGRQHVAG